MNIQLGIVIPVRNCLELTQDTIESIRTCQPYRLYIVDDHSDAEMKEWLGGLPLRFARTHHLSSREDDPGEGVACQTGESNLSGSLGKEPPPSPLLRKEGEGETPHPGLLLGKEKEEDNLSGSLGLTTSPPERVIVAEEGDRYEGSGCAWRTGDFANAVGEKITSRPSVAHPYAMNKDGAEDGRPSRTAIVIGDDGGNSNRPQSRPYEGDEDRNGVITIFTDPPYSTGVAYNWNVGIAAALLDGCTHIIVANNDILFHPKTIDLMVERMLQGDCTLLTAHDVGGDLSNPQDVYAWDARMEEEDNNPEFPCFMVTPDTIRTIGWFDENFLGAYFEDNDYQARVALADCKTVRLINAPVYHYGSATVRSNEDVFNKINQRVEHNRQYFQMKWGRTATNQESEIWATYFRMPFNDKRYCGEAPDLRLRDLFYRAVNTPSDINEHLDILYRLGSTVNTVTEICPSGAQTTCAFLYARPEKMTIYHETNDAHLNLAVTAARLAGIDVTWHRTEPGICIDNTDLLFIDSLHTEQQRYAELERYSRSVRRYIILHDTVTYGDYGETGDCTGIWHAVSRFLRTHSEWRLLHHFANNNGLTVLERR